MRRRVRVIALLTAGTLLVGAGAASAQGGLCRYMPQVRNAKFDPTQSFNQKLDQGCMILFDEWPENPGTDQISIYGLRDVAAAVSQLKLVLYDPPVPIDRLGDEGYEFVFSESTHHYGVAFRRGLIVVRIVGSGMRGSILPVYTRLAREIDDKLPQGGESVGPLPVPPPAPQPPPPVASPAPAAPPPSTGSPTTTTPDVAERAILNALAGAECNNLATVLQTSTDMDGRELAYAEAAKVSTAYRDLIAKSPVATPWSGPADRVLTHLVTLASLEDAGGKAIFPSARASVSVAAKLAVTAAADESAFIALRRLLAMLIRMDRPCP